MQPAIVLGSTHATVKHESFNGQRLVVLQPVKLDDQADGPPLIAIDALGSRKGDHVMITSDGTYAREATGHDNTPARWTVIGILDEN
ncbi:MAG: EutN/CcmL family microcompartment protein [Planctomycetota bacterium]